MRLLRHLTSVLLHVARLPRQIAPLALPLERLPWRMASGVPIVLVILAAALPALAQDVEYLTTDAAREAGFPFSEAVRVGNMLYLSGAIGVVPGTMELAEGGIEGETRQTMENIRSILERHGSSMNRVVRCLVMLADMSEWGAMNEVYVTFFDEHYPARSAMGVNGLALGARVEIECTATVK